MTTFTFAGNSQIEWEPLNATMQLISGDWVLNWDHNLRMGAPNEAIISQNFLNFAVVFTKGATVHTIKKYTDLTNVTLTYTEAEQITDFGAAVTSWDSVVIYGNNRYTGYGEPKTFIDLYDPGMMTYDGSTGYYNKTLTPSGNLTTMFATFNRASFTGASREELINYWGDNFFGRGLIWVWGPDAAAPERRNKAQVVVYNSAGTIIYNTVSKEEIIGDGDHFIYLAFNGDTGNAIFYIDGVDADDTTYSARTAPTVGTLDGGSSSDIGVGAAPNGANFYGGSAGSIGIANAYLTNPTDFYDPTTRLQELDTTGWTEFGSQPLVYAPDGKLDTNNLGSLGAFTKNGTITGPT